MNDRNGSAALPSYNLR